MHRNWLAITASVPLGQWYTEVRAGPTARSGVEPEPVAGRLNQLVRPLSRLVGQATSQWTLDYPPFFAWFEWLLGLPARWLHPAMLAVSANPVDDPTTVLYQRLTVILADLVLLAGVRRYNVHAWRSHLGKTVPLTWNVRRCACLTGGIGCCRRARPPRCSNKRSLPRSPFSTQASSSWTVMTCRAHRGSRRERT